MMAEENGRPRPRIASASVVGFSTVITVIVAGTLWLGSLNRGFDDMGTRVDKLERDNTAFQAEVRASLQMIASQLTAVQILVAKQGERGDGDATHRH